MKDEKKTKKQLFDELLEYREKVSKLEKIKAESHRLKTILSLAFDALNSSANGVILTDRRGRMLFVNPAFLKIFGYDEKEELLGKNAVDLFPTEKIKRFADVKAIIDEKRGETQEFIAQHKDGKKFPVEVSFSNISNHKGKIVGRMASFIDRSDKYRFKKGLKKEKNKVRILSSKLMEAEEKQKRLIASELHDGIGANLTAIKFALEEKISSMNEENEIKSGISIEQIVSMVRDTIEETHRISSDLRPSILDHMGIIATIHSVCREFQEVQSTIQIETMIDMEEEEIPESLKIVIYRVLQEALNNALKHSQADTVRVSLRNTVKGLELSVKDDGIGFDAEELLSKDDWMEGMGLSSMHERIELSGGFFNLLSQKGKGTVIQANWPL